MSSIQLYLLVACGGAIGAMLRFALSEAILASLGKGFPYATLTVNVLGSFVMGALYSAIQHELVTLVPWRTFVGIGLLGALTTFSTFSLDSLLLIQQGDWFKAGLNIVLNVCVCLLVAWLGMQWVASKI